MSALAPPYALLAELTHRCPLQCPYCSNPVALEGASAELTTDEWRRVIDEAAELGVLQIHFSGGEPTARRDLTALVAHANKAGLYGNLITSGVLLDAARLAALVEAGLEHVQLSFQDSTSGIADHIGGFKGGHARKLEVARLVREAGLPLTVNLVVHRQNLDHLEAMLALAVELGAQRVEVAHVQYYGWALTNRAALMPHARSARPRHRHGRGGARAAQGDHHHRLRRARLLRPPPQGVHGRLGPPVHQHLAGRPGAALPRRRSRLPGWRSIRCVGAALPISGRIRRPSSCFAAPPGCRSHAIPANGASSTGAVAVATLEKTFIPPSGFHVVPVLAYSPDPGPVTVMDAAETAIVARVPLRAFVNPENRLMVYRDTLTRRFAGPAFLLNEMLVWGFTGQVISALLDCAGWAQPWNTDDVRELDEAMALVDNRGDTGEDYLEARR